MNMALYYLYGVATFFICWTSEYLLIQSNLPPMQTNKSWRYSAEILSGLSWIQHPLVCLSCCLHYLGHSSGDHRKSFCTQSTKLKRSECHIGHILFLQQWPSWKGKLSWDPDKNMTRQPKFYYYDIISKVSSNIV